MLETYLHGVQTPPWKIVLRCLLISSATESHAVTYSSTGCVFISPMLLSIALPRNAQGCPLNVCFGCRLQTLESLQSMRRTTPIKQSPARSPSPSVYGKNAAGIQASSYSQLQEASIQVSLAGSFQGSQNCDMTWLSTLTSEVTMELVMQVELQQPRQQQQPKSPEDLQNIVTAVK